MNFFFRIFYYFRLKIDFSVVKEMKKKQNIELISRFKYA